MTKKAKSKQTSSSLELLTLLRIPLCKLCSADPAWGMVLTVQRLSRTAYWKQFWAAQKNVKVRTIM